MPVMYVCDGCRKVSPCLAEDNRIGTIAHMTATVAAPDDGDWFTAEGVTEDGDALVIVCGDCYRKAEDSDFIGTCLASPTMAVKSKIES